MWYLLGPYVPILIHGLWVSIYVSVISYIAGLCLAFCVYFAKASQRGSLKKVATVYVEILRNIPLLVVLYLIYFGLVRLGINVGPLWAALIGLTLNASAYLAEILRAGFESVSRGMYEAAEALGMTRVQAFRFGVLAPGLKGIMPALTNQFILLFLFSSVASIVSLPELTYRLEQVNSDTLLTFQVFTIGAAMYYAGVLVVTALSRLSERFFFRW